MIISSFTPLSNTNQKVSVILTTYNHERFIAKAINSILMQKVDFEYEIRIIEDCSTDSTRKIVVDFQNRYPDKIRLSLAEKNRNDNRDWAKAIQAAQSQYIALLDGDDYWTSPYKLQTQVDLLEDNKGCSICFHQVYNLYPDGNKLLYTENFDVESNKTVFTLEDLMFQNFLPTCSVVFRNQLFGEFPESFYDMPSPDWFLNVLNAQYGNIIYIDEIWGVRRVHSDGIISMKSPLEKWQFNITCIGIINAYLDYRYTRQANDRILSCHYHIVKLLIKEKNFDNARIHAKKGLAISPAGKRIYKLFLRAFILSGDSAPVFYHLLQLFRRTRERLKRTFLFLCHRK